MGSDQGGFSKIYLQSKLETEKFFTSYQKLFELLNFPKTELKTEKIKYLISI